MIAYYYVQNLVNKIYKTDSFFDMAMQMIPSIVHSLIIILLNIFYKIAAIKLSDWGKKNKNRNLFHFFSE